MKILNIFGIIIILASCATSAPAIKVDPFIKFYEQSYEGILPVTQEVTVNIIKNENYELLDQLSTQGYQMIGASTWEGSETNVTDAAINHAKNIGTEVIVYESKFKSSNPSSFTDSFGQTFYFENNRNSHQAIYLIKKNINKMKHGLYFEVLSSDEKQLYQTNYGLRVRTVINNYPAFNAGFIPGDIVLEKDGRKLIELEDYPNNNNINIFKVLRAGSLLELKIDNTNIAIKD